MIKGWFKQGDDWYYMNPADGAMLSGQWVDVDSMSFYMTKLGLMARNAYIKSDAGDIYHWVDDEGIYQKDYDTDKPDLEKYELVE